MSVRNPLGTTFEVCAEEIANAFGVPEALDVDGKCGEHLQNAIKKDPSSETSFARRDVLKVCRKLELFELVD